ncbi:sulfotransferase 6B1-like [Rhinatrema bivittatum]|uniref:sulfotransferase 6B1-like n=1 Tax=Rhinatrema bivittatum TaxID=194408 RepID=UPI00112DC2A4|nr:sulfotransferase 6B1-like [Rhinatrema bivittatum]
MAVQLISKFDAAINAATDLSDEELLVSCDGMTYPSTFTSLETLQALESFEARSDDLMVVGYAKSGTNWVVDILKGLAHTVSLSHTEESAEFPYLEFGDPKKYERMKKLPSPRVYVTYRYYSLLPKSVFKNKTKMLVLFRNPKDTAVSLFHFTNKLPSLPSFSSWDEFFPAFMSGKVGCCPYFDFAIDWNKHIDDENVMLITYEELKENMAVGVKRIAKFFGLSVTAEDIHSIVEKGTFQTMKEDSRNKLGAFGDMLFRKGTVGDWTNYFSEAQNQEMDAKFEECLGGTKLGAKLKYDVYCKK